MAVMGLTDADYALKRLAQSGRIPNSASTEHPWQQMIPDEDGWSGDGTLWVPLEVANPQGFGHNFAKAQAATSATKGFKWAMTKALGYAFGGVDGPTILATRNDEGSFYRAIAHEQDNLARGIGDHLAILGYLSGSGSLGRRASAATNVITLTSKYHARRFRIGMTVEANDSDDSVSPRAGSTTVTAVDPIAGTVTLASAAAITSFADNDFMFRSGDMGASPAGLKAWVPLTTPSATLFFNVDRSQDPIRLAGVRINNPGNTIQDNARDACSQLATYGTRRKKVGLLTPINFERLGKELGSKAERLPASEATFGYDTIKQLSSAGPVEWYADPDAEEDLGYIVTPETWIKKHIDGVPHLVQDDGNTALRDATTDSIVWRNRWWYNYICRSPRDQAVFAITPAP